MSTRAEDIQTELDLIKTAKEAVYKTGISYSYPGMTLTRANLSTLDDIERRLRKELAAINGTNAFYIDFSTGT